MKLLRIEKERYFFHLAHREKELLEFLLRLYPVIPPAQQAMSKAPAKQDESQRLLDEALAEQRNENKKLVVSLLNDAARFKESKTGIEMSLTPGEIEWVLQVLNDVRVGNWLLLGSPEELAQFNPDSQNAASVLTMEFAGRFQMELLNAVRRGG